MGCNINKNGRCSLTLSQSCLKSAFINTSWSIEFCALKYALNMHFERGLQNSQAKIVFFLNKTFFKIIISSIKQVHRD